MEQSKQAPQGQVAADPFLPDQGQRLRKLYIIAVCIFASVVPLVIATGLWLWMSISESRRELSSYLVVRAVQVKNDLDAWILEEYDVLEAIAEALHVKHDDLDGFQKMMVSVQEKVGRWKVMSLYDVKTGRMLRDTLGSAEQMPEPQILAAIRRAAAKGEPTLCTCFTQESTDNPMAGIHIFVPSFQDGSVHYILSVVLRYDTIQRMVVTAAAPFYDVGIIDENDAMIARTNRPGHFQGAPASEDFRLNAKGLSRAIGTLTGKTYTGNTSSAAFSRSELTNWTVITGTGADNVDALALQSRWAFFAITGLSLVLIAVLCIMVLYNVMLRRVGAERLAASRAFYDLQSQLLSATSDALKEQSKAASEREVLLREIYHRVKNNLQIIQSLMRLGARNLNEEQQEPFDAAVRRIGAMARVHTLLYNSPDLASIDLRDYLSSLVAEISESFGASARKIQTRLDLQSMRVPLDSAIPLAFISVELLANAFKHAFPDERENGVVTIVTRREDDRGVLIISDNGIGLPEFGEKHKTLGLNLVGRLVEQINGTMQTPAEGHSEYRITFPLVDQKSHSGER